MSGSGDSGIRVALVGGEDIHQRLALAEHLAAFGVHPTLVGSADQDSFRSHPYFRYSIARGLSPWSDFITIRQLAKVFNTDGGFDIIQTFDSKPGALTPFAARSVKTPIVRTITGLGRAHSNSRLRDRPLRALYNAAYRAGSGRINHTVFQNPDDERLFRESGLLNTGASTIIRSSGIDVDDLVARSRAAVEPDLEQDLDHPIVTMVARLTDAKGVLQLMAAAKIVLHAKPEARFWIVGPIEAPGGSACARALKENTDSRIRWLGPRTDVPTLLKRSTVFTLPSYYREGVPRACLEAAALGLPVVTTDHPGCRETVENGQTGYLVPTHDSPSLAARLLELLNNPELAREFGVAGSARVRAVFSIARIASEYADVYRRVLGANSVGGADRSDQEMAVAQSS